ncbi:MULTISPECIES: hypothetical protein [unclassified Staphylococcus]|uniref:hypothetical protein n=1 Tax=unclassified Staphylococcus TaxID=91994 RepID=UPI0021D2BD7A|nr:MULTISPECIES: hypothetical protein [unclassified Staphylococcus]UXR75589.1 hypothetical protein MUA74_07925 [Staphylococcus sp. IVB6233]UXR79790.1 hypothetical protein MUA65_07535 [Staphylococcus sp. IVB6218]
MDIELLGYHGTTQDSASSILKSNHFKKSTKKNEWLGHGVYFFELYEKAEWWVSKRSKPAIIETKILVPEKYYLDLDKPSEVDKLAEFIKFIEGSGRKFTIKGDKTQKRCAIINLYMQSCGFKVISATLLSTNKKYEKQLNSIGFHRSERQICVHDTQCIVYNELEIVS